MPTVHYSSRSFLLRLGVKDPPKTVDQIKTNLRRDPDYFHFPVSANNNNNDEDDGEHEPCVIVNNALPRQQSISEKNTDASKPSRKRKKNSPASVAEGCESDNSTTSKERSNGEFDIPIAERLKLRRNNTTTEETSTTTNVASQLAISERLRRRRNTQTAAVGEAQKRKKENLLNTDYEEKRGKVAKTNHPTDPTKRRSERKTSTVHVPQSSNNTIDQNQKILSHIKHRRQLLAWVRACRVATCKHYEELTGGDKVGFVQEMLSVSSGDDVNTQTSSSTTTNKSGDSTTIFKIVNRQDPEEGLESFDYLCNSNHIDCRTVGAKERLAKVRSTKKAKKASLLIDFKTVGVRQMPSGNWEVSYNYNGKRRIIGTYASQYQAALANKIARGMLMPTNKKSASEGGIQRNIELAKNAARKAVSDMVEIHHKISLESDTDQNGKALVSGSAAESTTSTDADVEQYHSMQQQRSNLQENVMPIYQPPSPQFEVQLDSRPWFYVDLHEKIQGPFDKIQMRQWDAAGYLEEDLLISQSWDGPYQALALLFPDRSTAFLPSTLDCETANDSEEEDRASSTDCNPGNDKVSWDYAVNCDGTSRFESLWQQRTRTDKEDNDQPQYHFYNADRSADVVSSLKGPANGSNDKMKLCQRTNSSHNSESATKNSDLDEEEYATVWKCDICRMAKFDTYEEAVEHENNCNRLSLHKDSRPKLLSGDIQPKKEFEAWLRDRKKQWGQQYNARKSSDIIPTKRHRRTFTIEKRLQILDELNGVDATAKSVGAKHNLPAENIVKWEKETELYLALVKEGKGYLTKIKSIKDPSIPAGVNVMANGRFQVALFYKSRQRSIGTFHTREEAILANTTARKFLLASNNDLSLTSDEIESNVKLAKEVALKAVSEIEPHD